MSRRRTLNYLQKYLCKNNLRKYVKYTGIGVGFTTAVPAVISNCEDDAGNIVANVNGGIRFLR